MILALPNPDDAFDDERQLREETVGAADEQAGASRLVAEAVAGNALT